eukprot:942447-Pelagomonas_calceolata.AAC.6
MAAQRIPYMVAFDGKPQPNNNGHRSKLRPGCLPMQALPISLSTRRSKAPGAWAARTGRRKGHCWMRKMKVGLRFYPLVGHKVEAQQGSLCLIKHVMPKTQVGSKVGAQLPHINCPRLVDCLESIRSCALKPSMKAMICHLCPALGIKCRRASVILISYVWEQTQTS